MEAVWRMGEGFVGGGGTILPEGSVEGSLDLGGARALMVGFEGATVGFERAVVAFGGDRVDAARFEATGGTPLTGPTFFFAGSGFFSSNAMVLWYFSSAFLFCSAVSLHSSPGQSGK